MKPINLLAAATALVMGATPAFAANWIYVTQSNVGTVSYYDVDTIQRSGNQVTVWEKRDESRNKTVKHREMTLRERFHCSERTFTTLNITTYYPDGTNKSANLETYEQKAEPIAPDTMGEAVLEAVCVMPADANAIP